MTDETRDERRARVREELNKTVERLRPEWEARRKAHLAELTEAVKTMSPDELIEAHARYVGAHDIQSEDVVRDEIVRLIELGRKADGNPIV
jgi:hypothetical protein